MTVRPEALTADQVRDAAETIARIPGTTQIVDITLALACEAYATGMPCDAARERIATAINERAERSHDELSATGDVDDDRLAAIVRGDGLALLPAATEHLALRCRATTNVVPYRLWIRLSLDARKRLERMSQTQARRVLAAKPGDR